MTFSALPFKPGFTGLFHGRPFRFCQRLNRVHCFSRGTRPPTVPAARPGGSKLEKSKLTSDAEVMALRKEARGLAAQVGRASGELDALRAQVVQQNGVIKGFAALSVKKTK